MTNGSGKIFRLRVLGDNFIILNDPKVAEDLVGDPLLSNLSIISHYNVAWQTLSQLRLQKVLTIRRVLSFRRPANDPHAI
jgi:hypothetical protein